VSLRSMQLQSSAVIVIFISYQLVIRTSGISDGELGIAADTAATTKEEEFGSAADTAATTAEIK
jgi:hypothetical protein